MHSPHRRIHEGAEKNGEIVRQYNWSISESLDHEHKPHQQTKARDCNMTTRPGKCKSHRLERSTSPPPVVTDSASSTLRVAATRHLHVCELIHLLTPESTPLVPTAAAPTSPPPSGALFMYDRGATRNFKKDGHDWVKRRVSTKRTSLKTREDDVKLRLDGKFRVAGWYARSAVRKTFRRRTYYLLDPANMKPQNNLVLVHYFDEETCGARCASVSKHTVDERGERRGAIASLSVLSSSPKTEAGGGNSEEAMLSPWCQRVDEKTVIRKMECVILEKNNSNKGGKDSLGFSVSDSVNNNDGTTGLEQLTSNDDNNGTGRGSRGLAPVTSFNPLDSSTGANSESCFQEKVRLPPSSRAYKTIAALRDFNEAPKITDEELAKEWESLPHVERQAAIADIYGSSVVDPTGQHYVPFERDLNSEIQSLLLSMLEDEINVIPLEDKLCFLLATQKCPRLASSSHVKLQFLRSEENCPRAAAHRLVRYWNKRVELFGHDYAFSPVTLEAALAGDYEEPGFGHARLLPGTDASGRGVVFLDNTVRGRLTTELRSMWYMAHAALENDLIQRNGIIFILFHSPSVDKLDRKATLEKQCLVRDILPLRLRAFHVCRFDMNGVFLPVSEAVKASMGKHMRARRVVHKGSVEQVLLQLAEFGMSRDQLPQRMGGAWTEDEFCRWIAWRRSAGR